MFCGVGGAGLVYKLATCVYNIYNILYDTSVFYRCIDFILNLSVDREKERGERERESRSHIVVNI